jgi:hypothetical protein
MHETAVTLLAAHVLADFVFQTDWIVANKRRTSVLVGHVLSVVMLTMLASGSLNPLILATVGVTHLILDKLKLKMPQDKRWPFFLDQLGHLVVITGITILAPDTFYNGFWGNLPAATQSLYLRCITLTLGAVVAIPMGGIVIRMLIDPLEPSSITNPQGELPLHETETTPIKGMISGGRYIGWLERAISMLLILTGKVEGVGFLLAAKSILRFGDIKDSTQRTQAEYIIIGTFLSFGWVLLVGFGTLVVLKRWTT